MEFDSIFALDRSGFTCSFGNKKFNLFHDLKLVGFSSLFDDDNLIHLIQLFHLMNPRNLVHEV